jgi:hypothetical protein
MSKHVNILGGYKKPIKYPEDFKMEDGEEKYHECEKCYSKIKIDTSRLDDGETVIVKCMFCKSDYKVKYTKEKSSDLSQEETMKVNGLPFSGSIGSVFINTTPVLVPPRKVMKIMHVGLSAKSLDSKDNKENDDDKK